MTNPLTNAKEYLDHLVAEDGVPGLLESTGVNFDELRELLNEIYMEELQVMEDPNDEEHVRAFVERVAIKMALIGIVLVYPEPESEPLAINMSPLQVTELFAELMRTGSVTVRLDAR